MHQITELKKKKNTVGTSFPKQEHSIHAGGK